MVVFPDFEFDDYYQADEDGMSKYVCEYKTNVRIQDKATGLWYFTLVMDRAYATHQNKDHVKEACLRRFIYNCYVATVCMKPVRNSEGLDGLGLFSLDIHNESEAERLGIKTT